MPVIDDIFNSLRHLSFRSAYPNPWGFAYLPYQSNVVKNINYERIYETGDGNGKY